MKKAVMLFAEGFETVEALAVVDILRRGGVKVTMAAINDEEMVKSAQDIYIMTDEVLGEVDIMDYDAIILPGGMPGTIRLGESEAVQKAIAAMNDAGKIVAAICAAPGVLGKAGLLEGKKACSYPEHEVNLLGATVVDTPVAEDGNIITSRGMGTAMEFGFALLNRLEGEAVTEEVKKSVIYAENH